MKNKKNKQTWTIIDTCNNEEIIKKTKVFETMANDSQKFSDIGQFISKTYTPN